MVRKYDSSRRRRAADQTRLDIIQAALKLHWAGITEFEPLAREAGCSVATLRKHFPSKESLYKDCTRTFAETLTMPDLAAIGAIAEPDRRIQQGVAELCRIHEAMFGYAWLCVKHRDTSPTLNNEMIAYEGLADAIATLIAPTDSPRSGLVRALLDFLSYRALRLAGNLSPEQAVAELTATLQNLLPSR